LKLLNKTEIISLKGTERKHEIDEAVKLARKVDTLRETSAKEEVNLAKFRSESLKKVQEDIDVLIQEKNALQAQTTALESQRKALLEPLDTKWEEIEAEDERLQKVIDGLENRNEYLNDKEFCLNNKDANLFLEENRIKDLKEQEVKKLAEIDQYNKQAEQLLKDTEQQTTQILTGLQKKEAELEHKQKQIEYSQVDNENKQKRLNEREQELNNRESKLNDRYATLERTLNRIKK
jgi:DNA repair exonuclease SbcCD ATPase subunit